MREYKIYLPLKYNDGQDIDEDKLREIKAELVEAFGGQFCDRSISGNLEIRRGRVS